MEMTKSDPGCEIHLAGEPHYLVDDAATILGVTRRTVIRYMDTGKLTRIYYDTRAVCIPAAEVDELRPQLASTGPKPKPSDDRPPNKPSDGPPKRGELTYEP